MYNTKRITCRRNKQEELSTKAISIHRKARVLKICRVKIEPDKLKQYVSSELRVYKEFGIRNSVSVKQLNTIIPGSYIG